MTPIEQDLLKIHGKSLSSARILAHDLDKINRAAMNSNTAWYGETIQPDKNENWWDTLSSLMQNVHKTSISSLDDDNRNDEKEIEILEAASKIKDIDIAASKDAEDFYTNKQIEAVRNGKYEVAAYYRKLAIDAKNRWMSYTKTREDADRLVKQDKQLFSLVGHNPIIEAIGEMADYTTTGAAIGATAGGVVAGSASFGIGSVPGSIIGAVIGALGGALYGGYDYIANGRNKIDRSAYTTPESENKLENYQNSIKTRQSYKDFRLNQIQDEQLDLLDWQRDYPVSDYYRDVEVAGTGNYLYYNMPGIFGSSFSDTKDMGQQMVGTYGLMRLANKVPKGKWAIRTLSFVEALKNGWQASLNENHAEASDTSTKKVLNLIRKNKSLSDEMISKARSTAMQIYGLSQDEANDLIDSETAFMMFQAGMGGLNPRKLENNYEFYKNARQLGDKGADTQFERDMVATAGGDILEAALMVTPYGAFAKKSKLLGRAFAGAAVGAAAGEFLGFGVGGSIIGGVAGGAAAQLPFARNLWRRAMKTTQQIEDKILPKLLQQIIFDKTMHAASAFGVTALAEAAEEGVQYLNSLDAEKILTDADDKLNLRNWNNLFVNDLKKRGEVFKAVLSQIGLGESPYLNDQEFWSNWKGGLFLGGLMTGVSVSLQESIGAKKSYQAARFVLNEILSSAVANRVASQDAILKGVAFAKYGANGNLQNVLEVLERAKQKNKNRLGTIYSDKDFDELIEQANRIISYGEYGPIKNRLKDLGYKIGSDEANYALSIYDYYTQLTRQNSKLAGSLNAKITQLMNDPKLMQALNNIAGEEILNEEDIVDDGSITIKEQQYDGTIIERNISNRERLRKLHQNVSQLIAITQLLKDLLDIETLKDFAKNKGIAFNDSQSSRSISRLKQLKDLLKHDVEIYSQSQYNDATTSYDQLIEYLKTLLLDQESGMKLADAYRDSTLTMLNQEVYSNIINALGLNARTNKVDNDIKSKSRSIVKMFRDNITKNKKLLEIVDYNIENNFDNVQPSQQDIDAAGAKQTNDVDFENSDASDIAEQLMHNPDLSLDDIKRIIEEKRSEFAENRDRASRKIFGRKKEKYWGLLVDKMDEVSNAIFKPTEDEVETDTSEAQINPEENTESTNQELEEQLIDSELDTNNEITYEELINDEAPLEELPIDEAPIEEQEYEQDETPVEDNDNIDTAPLESNDDSAIIHDGSEDVVIEEKDNQQESIDSLTAPVEKGVRKLMPGWYITSDGRIIPSERMYMANPTETRKGAVDRKGQSLSEKYLRIAAEIRYNIYRFLNNKEDDNKKLLRIKQYVTKILNTADVSIVDPISNALLNGDQNATKLLIMHANPRTWRSYYINEYFRDAYRRILEGKVVNRPDWIDAEIFKDFCIKAIQYKRVMEDHYGWKFITNPTPSITNINGQDVVGDPDFVAVDKGGNIHIVNIHTMKNDDYIRWGNKPISMTNTKSTFSIVEERQAYVDILIKALLTKPGVQISSAVLLPCVVDNYDSIHRLYTGKMIPIVPSEEAVTKYSSNEDQLKELNSLLQHANKKASEWVTYINDTIKYIKKYRKKYHTDGYRFKNNFEFTAEEEPKSVAEAYAQLDKVLNFVLRMQDFKTKHLDKELEAIEKALKEDSNNDKKQEVSRLIEYINSLPDETQDLGVDIEIIGIDDIANNKDLILKGKLKVSLVTTPESYYLKYEFEYNGNTYKVRTKKRKDNEGKSTYGLKNNGNSQTSHPNYTKKRQLIEDLLKRYPDVTVSVDLSRSYITYKEKDYGNKPTGLNEPESIITEHDIDNLGVLQNDGKIVDIGFYDEKTGVIQTGSRSTTAVLGRAQDGNYSQNKLFLVIKQNHLEDPKSPERRISIPLTKSKFNAKLSKFIAQCYRTIAITNHTADEDNQNKRLFANQMLHLFVGQRLIYRKDLEELPNTVYTNGDAVRLNGQEFYLHNEEDFNRFVKELQNCQIMPKWETFNVKFRNLADSSFSKLYDHFSESDSDLSISLDGVDSGYKITKKSFDNDTLCQWLVRNGFLGSMFFVENKMSFSIHNIKVGGNIQLEVKLDEKLESQPVYKEEVKSKDSDEVMTEEELNKLLQEDGVELVDDEEEDAEYDTPIIYSNNEYKDISKLQDVDDALNLIRTKYKTLFKLLKFAQNKIGSPTIKFIISNKTGEVKKVNGITTQKKAQAHRKQDGTWEITFYQGNSHPIKTLAHELVHVFTLGAIDRNTQYSRAGQIFFNYCKDTFTKEEKQLYGFKNFKEFVAEFFTNPELQQLLKSKGPIDESVLKQIKLVADIKPKNIFEQVVNYITNLWYKITNNKPSAYQQIYKVMENLVQDSYEFGKIDTVEEEDVISISDIMKGVVKDIKEKLSSRTDKPFVYKNRVTGRTIKLEHCTSISDLREAVNGIMTAWIRYENITALGGNIDKIKFSTADMEKKLEQDPDFAQWWHDIFEKSDKPIIKELTESTNLQKEQFISETNPKGYETYEGTVKVKKRVKIDGKIVTKTIKMQKTFYKIRLKNWDAITPIIDEFMSDMRIETRKKVELLAADEDMIEKEEGRNVMGELLTESYEVSPFDKASREVKWMFSTVPYGKVDMVNGEPVWSETTNHNKYGMSTFMPFRDVYGAVLYYTANCHTTELVRMKFYQLAHTGPNKAMFKYLYDRLTELINNRWRNESDVKGKSIHIKNSNGKVFDANVDSTIIKVIRSLRQQQNDFVWATAEDKTDNEGNKSKHIDIKTTLYQKGVIMAISSWRDSLVTGLSGIIKFDPKERRFIFLDKKDGNIFKRVYSDLFSGNESFLYCYDKLRDQNPEDIVVHWRHLPAEGVKFSEITADDVKSYLHNVLLEFGVDLREEVLDQWINDIMSNNPTVSTLMDAVYLMLSDQNSLYRPSNFFSRLAMDDSISLDAIVDAFNSGFIKQLANLQNEYNLRTQNLMTVASHNNQYYIVSDANYVNDIKDIINKQDPNDSYILMLKEDSFAQGSVLVEMLNSDEKIDLNVATFVGMKTRNVGDQGRDYFEIELNEDIISKFELLHEGYMISPTTSDKKTYHVLRGIPLVGMIIGKRTNTQCYGANLNFNEISIKDPKILDRFIKYFESEKNAVEKAIEAYESKFYKNNPGKKIKNYSDKNGMLFSSFNCIPLANGEKIYLNKVGQSPRDGLNLAYTYFFGDKVTLEQRRAIMSRILLQRASTDIAKAVEVGLIKKNSEGLYENIGLDGATINEMAQNIASQTYGENFILRDYIDQLTGLKKFGSRKQQCISAAIQQYIADCSIKHLMSMQEYQRLFSGSKSFYKWKDNKTHVTDISVDYTKRRGGDISTGGVNITDIDPLDGMEELGTYRCIEILDYTVQSTTLGQEALEEQFYLSEIASAAAVIMSDKQSSQLDLTAKNLSHTDNLYEHKDECEKVIAARYGEEFLNVIKQKAKANSMQYFRREGDEDNPVNVADGATYISDSLCEKLLREEGKWDDKMKYAFEVLRGKHGVDVLSEDGQKLYKSILDVIIGTLKYTATGFRKSDDGKGGTLMTPYYNKTALFPIFDLIAYGKFALIQEAMRKNNVDMLMMTSAVKVGSQGAIKIDDLLSGQDKSDHTYVQEMRFLRKQLNTDPSEREEMNLGTQTIKIALSNLRMEDDYTNPFTGKVIKGKDLYKNIMRSYRILGDIGYELIMLRFAKKDINGNVIYTNFLSADGGTGHMSMPEIDELALSNFLREELTSRDCNDNMLDAIAYDDENDRLSAPLSAISQSGWIDSIITSFIGKSIIDTKSPGAPYIQRSVFCMEGEGGKTIYNGEELKLINEDGSMDAVVSIDFFENIIPNYKDLTFEEARQWLIDHKLIGNKAKTYTISYRIPTQAQSSINPLKFVDVVPIIRDSIILPKEFTKLTGSDFDIDKLFLSRLFINPETIEDSELMFTFLDNIDNLSVENKLEILRKAYTNELFKNYLTLLTDKRSANTKWRPIDADTKLWEDVYKDLYSKSSEPLESMALDTIAYQSEQKDNFVTGKVGIGPYALNNNNHIYTMLYGISILDKSGLLMGLGKDKINMSTLYRDRDIYGNSILSWLSGGINAHVDIAKDPFVTKLNINKYTYSISNFLLRAGFGRNALWFLNLPTIKTLASRMNSVTGQYLKQSNKDIFEALADIMEKYKLELIDAIPQEIKDLEVDDKDLLKFISDILPGKKVTIADILYKSTEVGYEIRKSLSNLGLDRHEIVSYVNAWYKMCKMLTTKAFANDMVLTEKEKSILYRNVKGESGIVKILSILDYGSVYNYISLLVFEHINETQAKTTSDLTKFAKIDTKKQGSTVAAQIDFLHQYNKFVTRQGEDSMYANIDGDVDGFFGILNKDDLLGFDTSLTLFGQTQPNSLSGNLSLWAGDIVDGYYATGKTNGPTYASFIDNKTKKAINSVMCIIRNDSIEGTYGFQMIWETIKNDLGKGSLTEDMQSKLRSTILGAIKNEWVILTMNKLGIDPISLFKDSNDSLSLSHELIKLKTKRVSYIDSNGKKRFGTISNKYKDNQLLKILYDANTKEQYLESDKLIEILDFIMVHVPYTDDTKKANVYINSWRELYNDEATKDFAVKLMFYSFLVSNDTGGNNLFKYVPFEMLKDYGLFDAERSMILILGDPSMRFAVNNNDSSKVESFIQNIVDAVESILVEDFNFSKTYKLESIQEKTDDITGETHKVPRKEYVGFGTQFGNNADENNSSRIPYVFVPVRMSNRGGMYVSQTLSNATHSYIRILNPVANYENQQKYLIYKRLGYVLFHNKLLPVYKLVNNSMYSIGSYKIYNYNHSIDIQSSQMITLISKYIHSSKISIKELDNFISNVVKFANENSMGSSDNASLKDVLDPLFMIDQELLKLRNLRLLEEKIYYIKSLLLSKYDNHEYMREYINKNKTGKLQMISYLQFAINDKNFTQEEKILATDMLNSIKSWIAYEALAKSKNKQPNVLNDPKTYHMHSGGANGADVEWGNAAIKYGIPNDSQHISHYYSGFKSPSGNVEITLEEFQEGMNHVIIADQSLHRLDKLSEDKAANVYRLLARDWKQVKSSDAVFAIGQFKQGKVDGGTGWAVLMAIDSLKPVHVFDLNTQRWYTYDYDAKKFIVENTPKLTKNFAGIGTRTIDLDIEQKTIKQKHPVKYIGDAKREAALKAINDVFRNTFGESKEDGGVVNQQESVKPKNDPERFNTAEEDKLTIESNKTILSNEELAVWNEAGVGDNPRILVASERTDPAFHVKEIIDILDGKKSVDQWGVVDGKRKVVGKVSGKDFAGLYIITKHDGLPMEKLLKTGIPKLIHFSITGLGGTLYEPGVMKPNDLLDRIAEYIKMGLDPNTITIRIDPIVPGVTTPNMIRNIVKRASEMGIKRIRFSIMDAYPNTVESLSKIGYDFERNYGTNERTGRINFTAKPEIINKIVDLMILLKDEYGVSLGTCAEGLVREGISKEGCLSVDSVNRMLGTSILDKGVENNNQRQLCSCYGGKIDALAYGSICCSHCLYCYAKHENDKTLEYYNEDGTLKDNVYTKTSYRYSSENNTSAAHKLASELVKNNLKISVSKQLYTSKSVENPRTAIVFTENMQAEYARRNNTPSSSTLKLNVTEGTTGTNQAVVRMKDNVTYNLNAFGLVVKKYQLDKHGRWFYNDDGNFKDTEADFNMFKEANEEMFNRLSNFDGDDVIFPQSAAMGKAALPKRFAEWLAQQLYDRFGLFTVVSPNPKYEGKYGVYIYENTGIINVYSGERTNNLSNFNYRPFEATVSKNYNPLKVNSVEQAFLLTKLMFAKSKGDVTDQLVAKIGGDIISKSGSGIKSVGRTIPMSQQSIKEWSQDKDSNGETLSDKMLYRLMKASFEQNESARAELLRTGTAKITHNYQNGSPIEPNNPERFGRLLEKIRLDLRDQQQTEEICK